MLSRFSLRRQEVTAVAVHPYEDIVVSGQAGKEAIVCLFDASHRPEAGRRERDPGHGSTRTAGAGGGGAGGGVGVDAAGAAGAAGESGGTTPLFLRELSLGKKEKRGVRPVGCTPR